MNQTVEYEITFNNFLFYTNQIKNALDIYNNKTSNLFLLRDPIYSFFSGQELTKEHFDKYNPTLLSEGHLFYFLTHENFVHFIRKNQEPFYKWLRACYYYWTTYDPMCKLGSLIFPLIQHFLKPSRTITFLYQLHTLQSVIHYLIQYEDPLLDVAHIILIKYFPSEEESENKLEWELPILLTQDLILSRKPNTKENNDIRIKNIQSIKTIYDEESENFTHEGKIQILLKLFFHEQYYEYSYQELTKILTEEDIINTIKSGNTEFLKNIFATIFEKGDYPKCLTLLNLINQNENLASFSSQHGILIPNYQKFSLLTNNEQLNYFSLDQYPKYQKIIDIENQALTLSTILKDSPLNVLYQNKGKPYGSPNNEFDFSKFLDSTIDCYSLNSDIYEQLNYLTIVPSHSHPLQASLNHLGKLAPIINYSLKEMKDFHHSKKFAFLLSENSLMPDFEKNFIKNYFKEDILIIENPSESKIKEILNDISFTHIYISAHGNYEHSSRQVDSLEFNQGNIIPISVFDNLDNASEYQRIIILNACSGAHQGINLNFFHKGIASNLLKNQFVVFSNLWPISSEYAVILGILLIFNLHNNDDLREVYHSTLNTLKLDNAVIFETLKALHPAFEGIVKDISDTDKSFIKLNDFRNLGAFCLYN
ncbi:hypothetical protein [Acinetobacter variabilis]|uniref:hypothetical protein n=1 Tax=Acinetobacter variabilis TaxID=70346 RepID=UPI00289B24AB|nr:hypothetical protein [Acinetobacter variabilis]